MPDKKIVLSYRRKDSDAVARSICVKLKQHFGPERVFFDVDSIPGGMDFPDYIDGALQDCGAVLSIIGKKWTGPRPRRTPRIMEEDDWVRREVETALTRKIPVIPVLVGRAQLPPAEQLPDGLRTLWRHNAVPVDSGQDFELHMDRLIKALEHHVGAPDRSAGRSRQAGIATLAGFAARGINRYNPLAWRAPPILVYAAPAAAAILALALILLFLVPAAETRAYPGDHGRMAMFDFLVRMAWMPLPAQIALAALYLLVALALFQVRSKVDFRLSVVVGLCSALAFGGALYLYFFTAGTFKERDLGSFPYAGRVLLAAYEAGTWTDTSDAMYTALRGWIYFGMGWNALVLLAAIKNKGPALSPSSG